MSDKFKKGDFVWVRLPINPDKEVVGKIVDGPIKDILGNNPIDDHTDGFLVYLFVRGINDGSIVPISSSFFRPATQEEGITAQIVDD